MSPGEAVGPDASPEAEPGFAHASEAELARILDFYAVRWEYEPHTFPILWSLDGGVVESFTPDFYLPDLDLYLELTTLKQKLVRKKNRKLRRLRELYPDIRIKLFYARDFKMLMLKFGRVDLFDELSGTTGQVTVPRDDAILARVAVAAAAVAGASPDLAAPGAADTADLAAPRAGAVATVGALATGLAATTDERGTVTKAGRRGRNARRRRRQREEPTTTGAGRGT